MDEISARTTSSFWANQCFCQCSSKFNHSLCSKNLSSDRDFSKPKILLVHNALDEICHHFCCWSLHNVDILLRNGHVLFRPRIVAINPAIHSKYSSWKDIPDDVLDFSKAIKEPPVLSRLKIKSTRHHQKRPPIPITSDNLSGPN